MNFPLLYMVPTEALHVNWIASFQKNIYGFNCFTISMETVHMANSDQERTNQNMWIYLNTTLPYNNGTYRGFWLPNSPPPPPPRYPPIPLEIFSYGLYFPIKQISLGTPCSLEFPVTFLGVGRDAFWNYTILLLLLNQKNWKRLCSCNQPLVIFFTS